MITTINQTPRAGDRTKTRSNEGLSARVVDLPERFDVHSTVDFFLDSLDQGAAIVANASAVTFADRHALQSLVDARLAILDAGGEFILAAPSDELRATLDLTGFGALLWVIASPDESGVGYRTGECIINRCTLDGDLGPDRLDALAKTFDEMLSQPRPRFEIDLVGVGSLHLGVVNLLVSVRDQARAQLGDVAVIAAPGSQAHLALAQVGILGVMRP